jgi:hypothetical protein
MLPKCSPTARPVSSTQIEPESPLKLGIVPVTCSRSVSGTVAVSPMFGSPVILAAISAAFWPGWSS